MSKAVFRHVNLVAESWEKLAEFYKQVFGCEVVPPKRDLSGPELESVTRIPGAHLRGVHLRLPGCGDEGPTLEIFQYDKASHSAGGKLNAPGFAHIAFEVPDVVRALEHVVQHGGSSLGDVATLAVPGRGRVTLVYVRDPEGNVIELQSWELD